MSRVLNEMFQEQTRILFYNVQETFNAISENQMDEIICEWPLWKHYYHMLHSLDQWFINPFDFNEPLAHEAGLNSLYQKSTKKLTKAELIRYFESIKVKIEKYLNQIPDELLGEKPENCKYSRLTLILAQYRHLMYHIGFMHCIIFGNTGIWPEYIGISRPVLESAKQIAGETEE